MLSHFLTVASVIISLLVSVCTDALGFGSMLGAFLYGASVPFHVELRIPVRHALPILLYLGRGLAEPLRNVTLWLLLPLFYLQTGLQLELNEITFGQVCLF